MKRNGDNGFSLIEVTIATALMGIFMLGGMKIVDLVSTNKKKMNIKAKSILLNANMQKEFQKIKKGIFRKNFKPSSSFYRTTGVYGKATWADSAQKIKIDDPTIIFNDSHTLQIHNSQTNSNAILFSRCVQRPDFDKRFTDVEINDALALPNIPMVKIASGTSDQVYCCLKTNLSSCSDNILSKSSDYRVRNFRFFKSKLVQYPLGDDVKYIMSTGFFIYFNNTTIPFRFTIKIFSQYDRCHAGQNECSSLFLTDFITEQGAVLQSGIHDTGFLEIN